MLKNVFKEVFRNLQRLSGLRLDIRIGRLLVQSQLYTQPELDTQPHYAVCSERQIKLVQA